MGAFDSGFSQGRQIYNDAFEQRRQTKRDAMAEEEFGQKRTVYNQTQDQYKRTLGIQSDSDASDVALKNLMLRGRPVGLAATQAPAPNDPSADGSPGASPASPAYQGGTAPQAPPTVGLRAVGATPGVQAPAAGGMAQAPTKAQTASPREILYARMDGAIARKDSAAYAGLTTELQTMDRKDDQRNYLTTMQAMASDPAQSAAYAKEIGPAVKAFSEFNGIPSNFHYDPRTKGIVETPYGKTDAKTGKTTYGAPREVPFETMAPYLLAFRSLTSEYGDPETASAQMKNMSDAERAKRVSEATQTLDSAAKLSGAAAAQTHAGASMISAGAAATSAGAAVMNARTNAAYKDEQVGEIRENRKNRNDAAQFAAEYADLSDADKAGPKGKGVLRSFDMTNARNGGTVSPRGQDRQADPAKYFTAIKSAVESGAYKTQGEARAAVDEVFGLKSSGSAVNPALQKLNGGAASAQPAQGLQRNAVPAPNFGDMQFNATAKRAGYDSTVGKDGVTYFSRTVNGQGEILTGERLAERLGIIY